MGEKDLNENREFVDNNRESLLKEHRNKYLLVYQAQLISSYDTYETAANSGVEHFGLQANFLVHQLVDEEPLNFVIGARL